MTAFSRRGHPRCSSTIAGLSAILVVFLVACGDSTGPGEPGDPGDPGGGGGGGPAASVVIEPGAVLLTAAGETMQLEAKVYDAAGDPVEADVTWQSSDPGAVGVSADGVATAAAALGSAQITATADGVTSDPALAVVAEPAAGVLLVPDSLIATDPVAVDLDADYGPGWRYRIRVREIAPAAGQLVLGTGGRPLAGRVVSTSPLGAEIELTVELVPLKTLFRDLRIDERIPLVEAENGTGGSSWRVPDGFGADGVERDGLGAVWADTSFRIGRFECEASGETPDLDLPDPTYDIDPDLRLDLGYANGLERYVVVGGVEAEFAYRPVIELEFEGKVGCETVLTTVTIPLTGFLSWFVGIQVPIGIGVELEGKLEVGEVGFDIAATAEATAELGMLCPTGGGTCTGVSSFDMPQPDFDFELITPNLADEFKIELGAHGFLFARPSVGSRYSARTQFAFLEAKAGLEQSVDLATAKRQASESEYASSFKLAGLVEIGPGEDLQNAIDKLGEWLGNDLDLDLTLVDVDEPLAESPKGTFTITPASVAPGDGSTLGDMATFTIDLDPVTYLGLDAVESVEILWKKDDGSGDFTLEPGRPGCTDIAATSGQMVFTCQTDFLQEHAGPQTFYAFVHAKMFGVPLPLPLEVDDDGSATVIVGSTECGLPPGNSLLDSETGTIANEGGTAFGEVLTLEWIDVAVRGTVFAPDPGLGDAGYASAYALDYIYLQPTDTDRVGESVDLDVHVQGRLEVTGSPTTITDQFAFLGGSSSNAWRIPDFDPSNPQAGSLDIDEIASIPARLGEWSPIDAEVLAQAQAENGNSATSSASLRIVSLENVRDAQGQIVPIAGVCTDSGTEY